MPKGKYKSKDHEVRLIRAKTGHNKLNAHLHKLNFVDTHMCDCEEDTQNIEDVIMHCPLHTVNHNEMINTIELKYVQLVGEELEEIPIARLDLY